MVLIWQTHYRWHIIKVQQRNQTVKSTFKKIFWIKKVTGDKKLKIVSVVFTMSPSSTSDNKLLSSRETPLIFFFYIRSSLHCIWMYVCIHIYIYTYIYIYIYTYVHMYVCIYIYIHMYIYVYMYISDFCYAVFGKEKD